MNFLRILVFLVVMAISFVTASAWACNCLSFGFSEIVVGDDGIIPSNAAGFTWVTNVATDDLMDNILVEQIDGETRARVGFSIENPNDDVFIIRPTTWREGQKYHVRTEALFDDSWANPAEIIRDVELEVGPAIDTTVIPTLHAEPAALGVFALGNGASCSEDVEVMAIDIQMNNLPGDNAGFFFTTLVDGEDWAPKANDCRPNLPGSSWADRGQDRLVTICSRFGYADFSLAPGSHSVKMEARLPGTDIVYTTEALSLELLCPGDTVPDPTDIDAGSDAGDLADAGSDLSSVIETPAQDAAGGCQTTHGVDTTPFLVFLGLLGWRQPRLKMNQPQCID